VGDANGAEFAEAIVTDLAGNVYAAGRIRGSTGYYEYVTLRYDAGGNKIWERRYKGSGAAHEAPLALALDAAGNVFVTGESADANLGLVYGTIKYSQPSQSSNVSICTTTFTVLETIPPTVSCPGPITVSAGSNSFAAIPNVLSSVVASDNCTAAGLLSKIQTPPVGTLVGLGTNTVTVTVRDSSGNSNTCTTLVIVVDSASAGCPPSGVDTTPPAVTCPGMIIASPGTNCQAAVPNVLTNVTASDNCTPAGSLTKTQNPPAGTLVGLGTNIITVTVRDGSSNSSTCTTIFRVLDTTPPVVSCPGIIIASAATNCQAAVPNILTNVIASDNCTAAGSLTKTQNPTAGTMVGLGTNLITVTVRDAAGNSNTCTTTFTVLDTTPPTVTCPDAINASTVTNCQAAIPNVLPNVTASDNCTPAGSLTKTQNPAAGTLVGLGTNLITVTVRDAAGNSNTCTTTFRVLDATPPVVSCPGAITASTVTNCQAAIPNVLTNVTASDNCTPAGALTKTQNPTAGTLVGLGTNLITITVMDAAGNSNTCTMTCTVVDTTPPVFSCPALITASAGTNFQAAVPNLLTNFTASDNCTPAGSLTKTQNPTAGTLVGLGTSFITITVSDTAGNSNTCTASFEVVTNGSLAVEGISAPADPVPVGTEINVSAKFTDNIGPHTAVWDWGDGNSSAGAVTETDGSGSVTGSHAYTNAGVYTVRLTVTNQVGTSAQAVFQFVVVFDPDGGFVTGGGWINSPAGAYSGNPSLSGKATFGFVSKYLRGATVPTGNTEFQFKVASLNFKSSVYEWLVVAGARAQYKGSGTINGSGDYGFLLTCIDGQINGGGGTDKFRIKIWDKASSQVVYDNQLGDGDTANPSTVLGGGSIVIHKE
jgi:hypothetical protein